MEKALKDDIEYLETQSTHNDQILNDKKQELQNIREQKLKGEFVRSRLKWISDGEKPSKYFCGLEKKNYTEKTIRKLELCDETVITDQKLILKNIEKFYANLFKDRSSTCFANYPLIEKDIETLLQNNKKSIVTSVNLGHDLKTYEISQALKSMKNNKTPGIDGIPADFLKVFWYYLKYFIQRSLNCCFRKGKLSYSLRQSIIICIPKDTKDRRFLKNWRPISLLCVTYKLASTVIANRMKPYIDKIVSKSQTGFLSGRNISESTRLIYDIMHYTETKKINGILLLIDFAKAFDSISWTFIYKTLSYFGFDNELLKWIKMFNNNIIGRVCQSGFLSNPINIEKGCRQGDPISSYFFILAAEVLAILIGLNPDITGINIGKTQYKLVQFADDTSLILDGSLRSLQTSLNVLEIFGTLSGLKINHDKTKVIWIGKKRHSKDKLKVPVKLNWGESEFKLLGLHYSVDIEKIPEINYINAINKVCKLINLWNNRSLTPLGKVTVIKTLLLPQFNHLFTSLLTPKKYSGQYK